MGKFFRAHGVLLFGALFATQLAVAQDASLSIPSPQRGLWDKGRFSYLTILGSDANLENFGDENGTSTSYLRLITTYEIQKDALKLSADVRAIQDTAPVEKFAMANTRVYLTMKKYTVNKNITVTPVANSYLPTSEPSREDDSFRFGLGGQANFAGAWKYKKFDLTATYSPVYRMNNHQWVSRRDGSSNIQQSLRNVVELGASLKDWGVSVYGDHILGMNYNGRKSVTYEIGQTLSYALNKKTNLRLSHANGGDILGSGGRDIELRTFDSRTSSISLAVEIQN